MNYARFVRLALALATLAVATLAVPGCGHHSSVDLHEPQLERTESGEVQLTAQVTCFDSKMAQSFSAWWKDEDDCTRLEVCWEVAWLDAAPNGAGLSDEVWRAEHVLGTTRGCEQTAWPNDQESQASVSVVVRPEPSVRASDIAYAVIELDAPVDAGDVRQVRMIGGAP